MESAIEKQVKDKEAAPARRVGKLFRILVLGGVALAVAFASVPQGPTGVPDDNPSDGGSPSDGGGAPGW